MLRAILMSLAVFGGSVSGQVYAESNLEVVPAIQEKIMQEQMLDGVTEAVKQSTVAAQITGRITKIYFDVDDVVEKGAILLRIHDKEYKARLQQAEASVAEAEARNKDAEAEFKRVEGLYKDKVVSASDYDKAKANLKSSRAKIKAANGQLVEAQEQMENAIIRAPYSGIVVKRHVQQGETVRVGAPVMTGFSMDQLRVNVDVPQSHITAIRQFQKATVYGNAPEHVFAANKLTVFPYADEKNHSFRVRVYLAKGVEDMYPGMMVKVGFVVNELSRLLVPTQAVVHRVEVAAVYVLDEQGTLRMRQVRTGRVHGDKTEILAGLEAGENVVLDPMRAGALLKERLGAL